MEYKKKIKLNGGLKLRFGEYEEFKVEEAFFYSETAADCYAVKMYKRKLSGKKKEEAAVDNDILDFENEIDNMKKVIEKIANDKTKIIEQQQEEEMRLLQKRPIANQVQPVPTSVRKRRRGEGGVSATSAVTNPVYDDDDFAYDSNNNDE